ncbi:hypothetical protein CK203_000341 [Vitis vinifera]|uniref:Uncharacterized protein n=1 Tax=Vitis vinifera TaxID=29760 RepID=A0A438KQK8_VITVI|nr:hypothetical protein CK203_000341 [Vitis vinifera]
MEEAKTMKTPMSSSIKLDKDEKGKSIDSTMYRGMIGRSTGSSGCDLNTSRASFSPISSVLQGFGFGTDFSLHASQPVHSFRAPRGKRPTEPSQPAQTEARRKARFDTTLFSSGGLSEVQAKFAQRKVVPGRSINFSQLSISGLRAFQSDGLAASSDDFEPIFRLWCRLLFEGHMDLVDRLFPPLERGYSEDVRTCRPRDGQTIGHSLTVISESSPHDLLHPMPRGGHRDESTTRYSPMVASSLEFQGCRGRFEQRDRFEAPTFMIHMMSSLGAMKFEKAPMAPGLGERDHQHRPGTGTSASRVEEEAEIERWRDHLLSHHSLSSSHRDIPHQHLMLLIMPLDGFIYSDQLSWHSHGGACSRSHGSQQAAFEHLQQRIERIESRQESQHEEMMAYLRSVFPPPPPQP